MRISRQILAAFVLLSACAEKPIMPNSAEPKVIASAKKVEVPVEPAAKNEVKMPPSNLKKSDLRDQISDWLSENPQSNFKKASQMASRIMQKVGFPLQIDASSQLRRGQKSLILRTPKKTFYFLAGNELSENEEICGERYLQVPALISSEKSAVILSEGKKYPFSLKGFRREKFNIKNENKLIASILTPEPSEPIGVAPKGNALYMKFSLDEAKTSSWWTQIVSDFPELYGEDPYLVLRVEKNRLIFEDDIRHLAPQEFETEESGSETLRWRFKPSDFTVELPSRCGH